MEQLQISKSQMFRAAAQECKFPSVVMPANSYKDDQYSIKDVL